MSVESNLLAAPLSDTKVLIAKYLSDLDYYVKRLRKLKTIIKYPFFIDDLEEIKAASDEKFKYFDHLMKSENSDFKEVSELTRSGLPARENSPVANKIKWKANVNVLSTLFYDLLHGQAAKGPIIESSSKIVQDFLINNFVDFKGKPLKRSTVETHFSIEKIYKRAKKGDRIEINNVKLK